MDKIEFGSRHIADLIAIDAARIRRGETGIGSEAQDLIAHLASGGVSPGMRLGVGRRKKGEANLPDRDPRILQQSEVLWRWGWGRVLKIGSYREYLATIPDLPTFPESWDSRFPHLVLVDQRIPIVEASKILGVRFEGNSGTLVPHHAAESVTNPVYWMRCQDGKGCRDRTLSYCRTEFAARGDEVGCEAHEGLALYAQYPDLLELGTFWGLPGSVRADRRDGCGCLWRWANWGVTLREIWGGSPNPHCGFASRGSGALNP